MAHLPSFAARPPVLVVLVARLLTSATCLAVISLALSGCFLWSDSNDNAESRDSSEEGNDAGSSSDANDEEEEAKELIPDDAPDTSDSSEAELFVSAKRVYQTQTFSVAQKNLIDLRDRFPLGAYGQWASIKAADAYYYNGEMDKAAAAYEEYLKNFPGSVDTPYVKLQAARAHLASAQGVGRDRQPLERSLLLFDEIDSEYAGSPYAVAARSERTPALEELTAYDQFIINFYRKKGNTAAVQARQKMFEERWGARMRAGEFKVTSEEIPLEPLPAEVLENVSEEAPLIANEEAKDAAASAPPEVVEPERVELLNVVCDSADIPFAQLTLSRLPEEYSEGQVIERIRPEGGIVAVPDLTVHAPHTTFSCFGENDLTVSETGTVALQSSGSMILTTLQNPTRIQLTVIK